MFDPPLDLPTMPDAVTGVGAVAMPDGRVLICGGVIVEVQKGGVVSYTRSMVCKGHLGNVDIVPLCTH